MTDIEESELFAPEFITSKDGSLKLRKSEFYDDEKNIIKAFVMYKEIPPNNTPVAYAIIINEKKNYGLTIRKGKDRFWRITAVFSTSDKDKTFKNHVLSSALIVKEANINTALFEAEEDMPEIRRI